MDQIYAKVKRLRASPLRRVASDEKLFDGDPVDPSMRIPYSAETLLDEDEWFVVNNFSDRSYFPEFLRPDLVSSDVSELEKDQFEKISYLVAAQGDDFYFQRVVPSSMLKKKIIAFGDSAYLERPMTRIVVNMQPDAVFYRQSDELIFKDLARVSPIFTGIDELFREATSEQVNDFLSQDFISVDGFGIDDVSKPNRKRIALALESLGRMSDTERDSIFVYIREYCQSTLDYESDEGTFIVTSDEDVKNLTYGIEERFYTTTVLRERRLANSVIPL